MLAEYEKDHSTGMDVPAISNEIYTYTGRYPYLVSRLCQHIDTELDKDWSLHGVQDAVDIIIYEDNTLFNDIYSNLGPRKCNK